MSWEHYFLHDAESIPPQAPHSPFLSPTITTSQVRVSQRRERQLRDMHRLTELPLEILDTIAANIESPDDVLAFALTAKVFASIASPRHTQLRLIRCPQRTICVWGLLAEKAALAANVRTVHIELVDDQDHKRRRVPAAFITPCEDDCWFCARNRPHADWPFAKTKNVARRAQELLVAALKNMSGLKTFHWQTSAPFLLDDVCGALAAYCSDLREVVVREGHIGGIGESQLFNLSNLTVFEWQSPFRPQTAVADCTRLIAMLCERCPRLQGLSIRLRKDTAEGFPPPDMQNALFLGRWPELRSLTLSEVACSPEHAVAFLAAHPWLRHLTIDEWFGCRPIPENNFTFDWRPPVDQPLLCLPGMLPSLETLRCSPGQAVDLLKSAVAGPRVSRRIVVAVFSRRIHAGRETRMPKMMAFMETLPSPTRMITKLENGQRYLSFSQENAWEVVWVDPAAVDSPRPRLQILNDSEKN